VSSLPLVIGHRGASGYRPEHSRSAFELAFAQGADAVEPDLVATKDGVLVIRHENEISGTTDVASHPQFADRRTTKVIDGHEHTGWFTEDFTWPELSLLATRERLPKIRPSNALHADEGILRLSDLLTMLDVAPPSANRERIGLVAEIKHPSYFESIGLPLDQLLAAELAAGGWHDDDRLIVESFEETVLRQIRDRGIRATYALLVEAKGAPADQIAQHGSDARAYSSYFTPDGLTALGATVDGISFAKHILQSPDASGSPVGADLVPGAQAAGLAVFCWTLRAENNFLAKQLWNGASESAHGDWKTEFTDLMRMGVDGVFTDHPDLAIEARSALAE
jgi:glycerophosphoryl diester phosphodiesterase